MNGSAHHTLLLVEDDDVEAEVIQRSVRRQGLDNHIVHVFDGQAALDRLRGTDKEPPLQQPCLVLLDLNMPRMSGLEFLAVLRNDPALKETRVIVLTTSQSESDRQAAERFDVAHYMVKPRGDQGPALAAVLRDHIGLAPSADDRV